MKKVVSNIVIVLLVIISISPIVYIFSHSIKDSNLILRLYTNENIDIIKKAFVKPFFINLNQYYKVLFRTPKFLHMYWNLLIIVVTIVVFQTVLGTFSAYGFSKMKFKGSDIIFFIYIVIMLMPFQVTIVPNYIILSKLGLLDTYLSLIIPGIFSTFSTFMIKQFIDSIDNSFIEEAKVLGASDFEIVINIIFPMCRPIIVSVIMLLFIDYFSMIDAPIIFITSSSKMVLSVFLARISSSNIEIIFCCSVIYMILPLLLVFYCQNDLSDTLKITSLK